MAKIEFFSLLHSILMYYPAGQKFTQNRSISYSARDIKTFSFSAKIKVAITQLGTGLKICHYKIHQKVDEQHISQKSFKFNSFAVISDLLNGKP